MKKSLVSLLCLMLVIQLSAQQTPRDKGLSVITENALRAQVGFLASDWTEGRETGEKGEFLSADWIASMLQLFGAEPAGDMTRGIDRATGQLMQTRSYFQDFTLLATSAGDDQRLSVRISENGASRKIDFKYLTDFDVTPSEPGSTIEAPVVFAGYGYKDEKAGYNDFKNINVKGKFILRIAGYPDGYQPGASTLAQYGRGNPKDVIASQLGAVGIIEVDPGNLDGSGWAPQKEFANMAPSESRSRGRRVRYSIPQSTLSNNLPRVSVSLRVANFILTGRGIDIEKYISGNDQVPSQKETNGTIITLKTSMNSELVRVRNVLGKIEGTNPNEVIVLGAHYDHTGMSDGYIYNGADDNASGTVGVITMVRAFVASGIKPEKTLIFALWTGEEKGILGSEYFTQNPTVPLSNIRLNLNFDMISRYFSEEEPNKVIMFYSESCPEFKALTENNIKNYNLNLDTDFQPSAYPPLGSDHRSFLNVGIPIMRFKPGHREEYHTPEDETAILDWDIMEKIVKISFLNIYELSTTNW